MSVSQSPSLEFLGLDDEWEMPPQLLWWFKSRGGDAKHALPVASRFPYNNRPYVPSDPIQSIDWRAFARHDQLIVRNDQPDCTQNILISLDWSKSLDFPRSADFPGEKCFKKANLAINLFFFFLYHFVKAGNRVRIECRIGNSEDCIVGIPKDLSMIRDLFQRSQAVFLNGNPSSFEAIPVLLGEMASETKHSSFRVDRSFYISDLLSSVEQTGQQDISKEPGGYVIQCLHSKEHDLNWLKGQNFYDREIAKKKRFLGKELIEDRQLVMARDSWHMQMDRNCSEMGQKLVRVYEDMPIATFFHLLVDPVLGGAMK